MRSSSAAASFLGTQIRIVFRAWMLLYRVSCVLGRQWLLRRAANSVRKVLLTACVCLIMCDLETSKQRERMVWGVQPLKKFYKYILIALHIWVLVSL